MSLIVEGALEFEQRSSHPNPPTDGGVLLYVFEDGQLYAASSPVAGPGGSSRGGQPGQVWYDTNRAPLVFVDTVAAPGQLPNAGNVDVTNFVNNDLVVRLSDYELFQWQVSFISSSMVDLGVKWAGQIANGVPVGGTAGQILAKNSGTDFDTKWEAAPSGGGGGSTVSNVASMNTGARAYRNGALNLAASTWTKLGLDTITFDPGNHFSTANGRYVAPASGLYQINVDFEVDDATVGTYTEMIIAAVKNGNGPVGGGTSLMQTNQFVAVENVYSASISDVAQLSAGDYVEFWVWNSQAEPVPIAASVNYMSVVQVDVALQPSSGQVSPGTAARAYRAAALPLGANASTKVPFDAVSFDPGGHFNLTNGRYVAPATGYYQVTGSASANLTAGGQEIFASVYKNGSPLFDGNIVLGGGAGTEDSVVADIVQLNAGEYLELYCFSTTALNWNTGPTFGFLSVVQVDQPIGGAGGNAVTPTTGGRAYRAAAFSMPASTLVKIPVDTTGTNPNTDPGGHFATGNRYNVTVAGWYLAIGNVAPSASDTSIAALLYKNGVQAATGTSAAPGLDQNVSDLIYCNPGDYLELWGYNGSTSVMPLAVGSSNNFLSVVQVDQPTPVATNTGARAFRNAALSLTANTDFPIPVDTVTKDPGGHFSGGKYNVTAAGWYQVNAEVCVTTGAPSVGNFTLTAEIAVGASVVAQGQFDGWTTAGGIAAATVSDLVYCNPGDTIGLVAFGSGSWALSVGTLHNYISVVKVDQPLYANNPTVVTALPANPFEGQEVYFVADAANGVKWHLRYNAGSSSTHKWEYLGGPNMISRVDTDETYTSTAGFTLAPTPDRLTFPLSGDYEYDFTVEPYQTSAATTTSVALSINGAAPLAPDFAQISSSGAAQTVTKPGNLVNMVAGQTVAMEYNNPTGGGVTHVRYRLLRIKPIRLG